MRRQESPKEKVKELRERVFGTSPVGTTLDKEVKIVPEFVERRFVWPPEG